MELYEINTKLKIKLKNLEEIIIALNKKTIFKEEFYPTLRQFLMVV